MHARFALLLALVVLGAAHCGAARPAPRRAPPRRSLLAVIIGGGGGFGGGRRDCYGPNCLASRQGTAQTLATLNAQRAVGLAVDSGADPYATFASTQSASRSAIAAAQGNVEYLQFQPVYDPALNANPYGYGSWGWGRRRAL
ncbi:MAG: hypothetical protein J3K34DRAFT_199293 [Monoraphidium minutum]|nr:MAG: hypothetical protein J3K34DRAFT_199293 [Monoraphidium minutum]